MAPDDPPDRAWRGAVRPTESPHDWASVEVAVPRLPGVSMAGFRQRAPARGDITMVAHPSVTLFVDLREGDSLVYDANGRRERGSTVVGLIPRDLRLGGGPDRGIECLQIRLSPVLAVAVLGASTDLSGAVVSLGMSGAATPCGPRTGCGPPRRGTSGSRSRRTSSADG